MSPFTMEEKEIQELLKDYVDSLAKNRGIPTS